MDRSRLREVAREFELRVILERLEEELGADFVPDAKVDEELDVDRGGGRDRRPRQGRGRARDRGRDLVAATTARSSSRASCPDLAELAKALGDRRADRPRPEEPRGRRPPRPARRAADGARPPPRHDGRRLPARPGAAHLRPDRHRRPARPRSRDEGRPTAPDGDQLELGEEPPPDPAAEARLVWEIAQLQRKGIEEGGLEQLMDEVEMPLVEVLAAMEQNGVMLDAEAARRHRRGLRAADRDAPGRDLRARRRTSSRSARRSSSPRSSSTSSG